MLRKNEPRSGPRGLLHHTARRHDPRSDAPLPGDDYRGSGDAAGRAKARRKPDECEVFQVGVDTCPYTCLAYVYARVSTRIYAHASTYASTRVSTHLSTDIYTHACTYVYAHFTTHFYTHTCL